MDTDAGRAVVDAQTLGHGGEVEVGQVTQGDRLTLAGRQIGQGRTQGGQMFGPGVGRGGVRGQVRRQGLFLSPTTPPGVVAGVHSDPRHPGRGRAGRIGAGSKPVGAGADREQAVLHGVFGGVRIPKQAQGDAPAQAAVRGDHVLPRLAVSGILGEAKDGIGWRMGHGHLHQYRPGWECYRQAGLGAMLAPAIHWRSTSQALQVPWPWSALTACRAWGTTVLPLIIHRHIPPSGPVPTTGIRRTLCLGFLF